jgi:hypothetical protein
MKPLQIIQQSAITTVATLLADGSTFNRIKNVVIRLENKDLPNNEKRQVALEEFKTIGLELAGWLARVLLELAVTWLRVQTK